MEKRPPKIALVYDAIFPFVKGGAEKRFFEVGKRLARRGYSVHLYGMKGWEGPDIIEREGMTLHALMDKRPLYTSSGRRSISQALLFGLACWRLLGEEFDLMDCCGFPYFSLFPARVICSIRHKPLYSTWHEVWGRDYWRRYLGSWGYLGYLTERLACRMPDTILAVSDLTAAEIRDQLGREGETLTVTNGIDLDRIEGIERAEQGSDILFVGRLVRHKNAQQLIDSLALLREDHPRIQLEIIGRGPEEGKLRNSVKRLGLEGNVRFCGFLPEDEVYAHMKASRLLALPSSREGFGMVVLEANACDLPVVTSDHPQNAARHLIRPGSNGQLCSPDAASLARSMAVLLQTEEDLHPRRGLEEHDWEKVTERVAQAFALASNPPA